MSETAVLIRPCCPMFGAGAHQASRFRVSAQEKVLILAVGNPLRADDGVGSAILESLARVDSLPPGVMLMDLGTGDLFMALFKQRCRRLIIIDACELGLSPGEWRRFTPEDCITSMIPSGGSLHSHGWNLTDTLALARLLDPSPLKIVIYGVQPSLTSYSLGLSRPVETAVSEICSAIRKELDDDSGDGHKHIY